MPTPAFSVERWTRFQQRFHEYPSCGLSLDLSRLDFEDGFLKDMEQPLKAAMKAMRDLEAGGEANKDEGRMVGHYWLRQASLAPSAEWQEAIASTIEEVGEFAAGVHQGRVVGAGGKFSDVLVIGIGGSALGPQFIADALGQPSTDRMKIHFFDNTDPDGMDRTLAPLVDHLGRTLVLVISKSGDTPETRNGMAEAEEAYRRKGLDFARHAVAITECVREKSALFRKAQDENWLRHFPMWDWVGGRTSVTSAVGLLPAALQGIRIDDLLKGARDCDALTRNLDPLRNPAALLALGWYHAGQGRGARDMVILPYKDRLALFAKYLQQLVMESLGKRLDRAGRVVHQGLAVYGNKGSTDQHAYVQQLRDGLNNFFVVFIQVLRGRAGDSKEVADGATSADFLHGFLVGTRSALHAMGRESLTLTVPEVTPATVGTLIALFERAVGLYAELININAYHQPGVQAGKAAAKAVLKLQARVLETVRQHPGREFSPEDLARELQDADPETVFHLCRHLAANGRGLTRIGDGVEARFKA